MVFDFTKLRVTPNVFNSKHGGIGERIIDAGLAEHVYGTSDDFLRSYREFESYYFEMLSDPTNLKRSYSKNLDIATRRQAGIIDFSLLNYEAQTKVQQRYRGQVLRMEGLMANAGLPSISFPTANPYSFPFKFEVDQNVAHPAQVLLNRMIFNIDPNKSSISDIKFGGQNIMSAQDIERNLYQIQRMKQGTLLREGAKIATVDIETTGILPGSQARSFAVAMRDSLEGVPTITKFGYDSPQLGGILVGRNLSETLSGFIGRTENLGSLARNEEDFLGNFKSMMKKLVEADQVTGHNVKFDITQSLKTVTSMAGYSADTELQDLVGKFLERSNTQSDFLIDTLEIGRAYITEKAQSVMGGIQDPVARGQGYMSRFFSNESLADVAMGGRSTYVGVENFAMNTNLIDLIAEEEYAPAIFQKIFQGSHIAETDTILQDHILKYIHNKKLTFRDMHQVGDRKVDQEAIDMARRTVFKSSATTSVTNIADPRYLSQTALDYVLGDEGIKGVRAMISQADAAAIATGDLTGMGQEGFIKYQGGQYKLFSGQQEIALDQMRAAEYLRSQVRQASAGTNMRTIANVGTYNMAEKNIISLGVTFGQSSDMEIMRRAASVPSTAVDPTAYVRNVGLMYSSFGNEPTLAEEFSLIRNKTQQAGIENLKMNFDLGVNSANASAAEVIAKKISYAEAMLGSGNKYGFLGETSAILSSGLSRGTQGLASEMYAKAVAGEYEDDLSKRIIGQLGYAYNEEIADVTSQFGTSIFSKQTGIRTLSMSGDPAKILMSYDYFKGATNQSGATMADALAKRQVSVSLSLAQTTNEAGQAEEYLNLVWKAGRDQSGITSQDIAARLYDDMMESDAMKNMAQKTNAEVQEEVAKFQMQYGKMQRTDAIAEIAQNIEERGIVIGQYRGSGMQGIKNLFERMGLDLTSDAYNSLSMNLLDEIGDAVVTGALYDAKTVAASGAQEMLNIANESAISSRTAVAEALSSDPQLLSQARRNMKAGRRMGHVSNAVDMYNKYKGKAGIAALGLTALVGGYYMYENYKENQLYNETLEQQPYEKARQVDSINSYTSQIAQQPSYRRDPLVTAGVVGNLDRRKIGHTQMGNNKYAHLYGG